MKRIPWLWTGVIVALSIVPLLLGGYVKQGLIGAAASLGWLMLPALFTTLGSIIARRHPGNRISWILLVVGFALIANTISDAVVSNQQGIPAWWENVALAVSGGGWIVVVFPIFLLLFLFPTGRFLTPRWRWAGWLAAFMIGLFLLVSLFVEEWGNPETWIVANPIGFLPVDFFDGPFGAVWTFGLLSLAIGGVTAMGARFKRAATIERTQIKWILYAAAVFAIGFTLVAILQAAAGSDSLILFFLDFSLAGLPISIAAAITRYKLFEIDRIISRTLSYTAVVAVLGALFFGLVTLVTSLLPTQSSLAVAGATLAAAALFNPVRRRVQHAVDRRFNRSRYEAEIISDQFSAMLQESLTAEQLSEVWGRAVTEALQPEAIGIWLRTT